MDYSDAYTQKDFDNALFGKVYPVAIFIFKYFNPFECLVGNLTILCMSGICISSASVDSLVTVLVSASDVIVCSSVTSYYIYWLLPLICLRLLITTSFHSFNYCHNLSSVIILEPSPSSVRSVQHLFQYVWISRIYLQQLHCILKTFYCFWSVYN